MQWAARANEASRQLRDPLLRARYLCEQAGVDLQTESNTSMDGAFLMQQMTWREMLDDARGDAGALAALQGELEQARATMRATLTRLLDDERDYAAAGLKVREWMFVEKLAEELAHAQPAG
jgi:molecular chaperone HscB